MNAKLKSVAGQLLFVGAIVGVAIHIGAITPNASLYKLLGGIAAAIIVPGLLPARWSDLGTGVALLGLAAWFYFNWAGGRLPAAALGVFGAYSLFKGIATLTKSSKTSA